MEIMQTLRQYIFDNILFEEDATLQAETSFLDSGIIDSTGILEIVAFIEQCYNITIEDQEIVPENLDSLQAISKFVQYKIRCFC